MSETRRRLADEPWRKVYSTQRWKRVRAVARRRAGGLCERCGREAALDVHHRVALKDGGAPYDADNLEVVCRPCHSAIEASGSRFFSTRPPTTPPVGISPPEGRNPRVSPAKLTRDAPMRPKGWYAEGGAGTGPCSRQWGDDYVWVGPGDPPPGSLLVERAAD